ncbi:isoprenylcysteine carboxylmethyltransferase family protein [Conexibacter sp. W3-3-2]|uniref:methyltransferase family protein n=1 Tax=Conexibacter sp. W3-3-2 TaxID=2675227 RepID=UPI0012B986DF|nr:isoprenylcysteine carboxylmethyltransferase family protein [Conexibacter sp. W3-3-2]MTD47510.1 isoprenylcysteine carboxylmethyltransferase family protein [Conexibacter sp. W3-3-2]
MSALALVLFLGYLLVVFAGRAVLLKRRTGTAGWRGITGRPGSAAWLGGVLFAVALVIGLAAPVAALLGASNAFDIAGARWLGLALFLGGWIGSVAAQQAMGATWRVGVEATEQTDLVRDGVFGTIRNPFFSALLLSAFGLALLVPGILAFAALLLLVFAVELQVRVVEEPHLLAQHGDRYREYASRAGRFLPGIGTMRRS